MPRRTKHTFAAWAVQQGTLFGTTPSPRTLPPRPTHTAASGRLSALWFKDRKALPGWERAEESGCGPHSAGIAHPSPTRSLCPALFLMEQEILDIRNFLLCSAGTFGSCLRVPDRALVPRVLPPSADWNFHAEGPNLASFHVGAQPASPPLPVGQHPLPQAPSLCRSVTLI